MVRLVVLILLSVAAGCAGWQLAVRESCPLARHARQPHPPLVTMKGRSQGGGPRISTKKKKAKHTPAALAKAGSPAPQNKPLKKVPSAPGMQAPLSIKRQWDRHLENLKKGAKPHPVYARARGTEAWLKVGTVTVDPEAKETSPEQAVQLHKRLILSHAVRLHPELSPSRTDLDCGFGPPENREEKPDGELKADGTEPVGVEESEPEVQMLESVDAALPALAGFAGTPDESSGHYFVENEPLPNQEGKKAGKKVIRDKLGNDTKSKVAEAFSKSLGLRSG